MFNLSVSWSEGIQLYCDIWINQQPVLTGVKGLMCNVSLLLISTLKLHLSNTMNSEHLCRRYFRLCLIYPNYFDLLLDSEINHGFWDHVQFAKVCKCKMPSIQGQQKKMKCPVTSLFKNLLKKYVLDLGRYSFIEKKKRWFLHYDWDWILFEKKII